MSKFVNMAMDILNIKNHITTDELKNEIDVKSVLTDNKISKLNESINNCHTRIDMYIDDMKKNEAVKQIRIDELKELFYKEL